MANSSSERVPCRLGEYSYVNVTYDNYVALLVGTEDFSLMGRVGVCQDGFYGSICDVNWDQEDANVICNGTDLGFVFGEHLIFKHGKLWPLYC